MKVTEPSFRDRFVDKIEKFARNLGERLRANFSILSRKRSLNAGSVPFIEAAQLTICSLLASIRKARAWPASVRSDLSPRDKNSNAPGHKQCKSCYREFVRPRARDTAVRSRPQNQFH